MYTFMNTLDKIKLLNDGPQVRNYLDAYSYLKGLKKQQQEDLTRIIHNSPNLVAQGFLLFSILQACNSNTREAETIGF